jgi:hypothetical protein
MQFRAGHHQWKVNTNSRSFPHISHKITRNMTSAILLEVNSFACVHLLASFDFQCLCVSLILAGLCQKITRKKRWTKRSSTYRSRMARSPPIVPPNLNFFARIWDSNSSGTTWDCSKRGRASSCSIGWIHEWFANALNDKSRI